MLTFLLVELLQFGTETPNLCDAQMSTATLKTAADTECAQTLLQLATSTSPPHPVAASDKSHASLAKRDGQTIYRNRSSLSESSVKSRILKQQLEGKMKGGLLPASWLVSCKQSDSGHPIDSSVLEPPGELTKRIRLDHNYSRMVEERYYDYRHMDEYDCYGDSGQTGLTRALPNDVRSKRDVASKLIGHKKVYKRSPNKTYSSSSKTKDRASDNLKLDRYKFPKEEYIDTNMEAFDCSHKINEAAENDLNSAADLYEPSSSKFKNFHLLLTCLSSEKCTMEKLSHKKHTPDIGGRDNLYEQTESELGFGMVMTDTEVKQFECLCCHKTFTKRRYLTKHMRRMHPGMNILPTPKEDPILVLCPNCGNSIPRRNFRRHSTSCNTHLWKTKRQLEVDLANCQFCGVRMRRHVLVKHLAQEHCVENLKGAGDNDSDSELSDAENDTDSVQSGGSSWATCDICMEHVEDFALGQHIAEKHPTASTLSDSVSCQLCGAQMMPHTLMAHLTDEHRVSSHDCSAGAVPTPGDGADTLFSHSLLKAILDSSKRGFAGRHGSESSDTIKSVSVVAVPSSEGLNDSLMVSSEPLDSVQNGPVGMPSGGRMSPVPVQ